MTDNSFVHSIYCSSMAQFNEAFKLHPYVDLRYA